MHAFNLIKQAQFKEKGVGVQVIAQSGHARYVLFSFRAGQGLKEHQTSSQISVQVLSGKVDFSARGETQTLAVGQIVLLEAGVPHGVEALEDSIMLLIMTPDPQSHTLSEELFDEIRPIINSAE